jgi:simple sugar transport system ATP-binding protein
LDEPTAALGVKQAGVVLRYVAQARARGLGVIFITHNPHHAYAVGDRFTILKRGRCYGTFTKAELSREEMVRLMSGADELDEMSHELEEAAIEARSDADGLSQIDHDLASSLEKGEDIFRRS